MKKYVLYGAAAIGGLAKESIEKTGDVVIGYLDKRAQEISEYEGLSVYLPNNAPAQFFSKDVIIFISVKNVFEHEKIAHELYKEGFKNIVYKPYEVLMGFGTKRAQKLAKIYDDIFEGKRVEEDIFVNNVSSIRTEIHDYAQIYEKGDRILAYIPVEYIFTNNYKDGGMVKWGNIPIAGLFTHINFFRSLEGDISVSADAYLKEYCVYTAILQKKIKITDAWKENVIENRTQIYEQMRDAQNLDPLFFVRNAATATWNKKEKYFNLTSGKHRCSFLVSRGMKYIPLEISREDYNAFSKKKEACNLVEYINTIEENIIIPNPFFYRGILFSDRGEYDFLLWFTRRYAESAYNICEKVDFSIYCVADMLNDYGHMARYLKRIGMSVKRYSSTMAVEQKLNNFFQENIEYSENNVIDASIAIIDIGDIDKIERYDWNNVQEAIIRGTREKAIFLKEKNNFLSCELISIRNVGLKKQGVYLLTR